MRWMPTAALERPNPSPLPEGEGASKPSPSGRGLGEGEADPIALRSQTLVTGFTRYLRWYTARNFHAVRVARAGVPDIPAGRPVILYGNHPSWWDPTIYYLLAGRFMPQHRGFAPMDAASLARYRVFRRLGVFGIEPGPRGAARFLRVSREVLADPRNALWITAEGDFTDARERPVRLRPGLAHAVRATPEATVLPLALEYPFWNERKPEALARFGPPIATGGARDIAALTRQLAGALESSMDALASDSRRRDPALFVTLHRGTVGVGGAYDIGRRARALLAGRRFDPSHEPNSQ